MNFAVIDDVMKTLDFQCRNVIFSSFAIIYTHKYFIQIQFLLFILQSDDASILYEELLKRGLEKWWPSDPTKDGVCGVAIFRTFEHAIEVLINGSSINSVTIQNRWYSKWPSITSANRDKTLFKAMDEALNEDCIDEIIKYIDIPHRMHFASFNVRFKSILLNSILTHDLKIFPSSVKNFGLVNFRHLLVEFGSSMVNLSVSLLSFTSTFGFYFTHIKMYILEIIHACALPKLKKINLYDFDLNENEERKFESIFQLFVQRGIEVNRN